MLNFIVDETKDSSVLERSFCAPIRYRPGSTKKIRFHLTLLVKHKNESGLLPCQLKVFRAGLDERYKFNAKSVEDAKDAKSKALFIFDKYYSVAEVVKRDLDF